MLGARDTTYWALALLKHWFLTFLARESRKHSSDQPVWIPLQQGFLTFLPRLPLAERKKYNLHPVYHYCFFNTEKFSLVYNSKILPPRQVKLAPGGKFTPG